MWKIQQRTLSERLSAQALPGSMQWVSRFVAVTCSDIMFWIVSLNTFQDLRRTAITILYLFKTWQICELSACIYYHKPVRQIKKA